MSPSSSLLLSADGLWEQICQQTAHALQCGALQPIDTDFDFVEQDGMRFLVRILANLVRKEKAKADQTQQTAKGKPFNPFLPYEPDLFVTDISATHLCLLNKYNVVDHHILIVTRAFEHQDSWLTWTDFQALAACLAQIGGLAFYNGGKLAGASQPHKHLQITPLPMAPDGSELPLTPLMQSLPESGKPQELPDLPFVHGAMRLPAGWLDAVDNAAASLLSAYRELLAYVAIDLDQPAPQTPYNLLITREWLMVVPRCQDAYETIPVNSLGFAGSLLVKNSDQMARLKAIGPMNLLKHVGQSR